MVYKLDHDPQWHHLSSGNLRINIASLQVRTLGSNDRENGNRRGVRETGSGNVTSDVFSCVKLDYLTRIVDLIIAYISAAKNNAYNIISEESSV